MKKNSTTARTSTESSWSGVYWFIKVELEGRAASHWQKVSQFAHGLLRPLKGDLWNHVKGPCHNEYKWVMYFDLKVVVMMCGMQTTTRNMCPLCLWDRRKDSEHWTRFVKVWHWSKWIFRKMLHKLLIGVASDPKRNHNQISLLHNSTDDEYHCPVHQWRGKQCLWKKLDSNYCRWVEDWLASIVVVRSHGIHGILSTVPPNLQHGYVTQSLLAADKDTTVWHQGYQREACTTL